MSFFNQSELIQRGSLIELSSAKSAGVVLKESFSAFSATPGYDIFLSHSYKDAKLILGLKQAIEDMGFTVYVDWIEDKQLDRSSVTKETANRLRERMKSCKCLFFATSMNSPGSKWMPWELGYFDGIKGKVAILPIAETTRIEDEYKGQEYLGLYPYITKNYIQNTKKLALWVRESSRVYVILTGWLSGTKPHKR